MGLDDQDRVADELRFRTLSEVIGALQRVDVDARKRILSAVGTYFGIGDNVSVRIEPSSLSRVHQPTASFSEDRSMSPKEFLLQKRPQTDVERVACLAYYLTHYRDNPRFKTFDISKLNTEAAQVKLSNAAYAVDNAAKKGFITSATQGAKQITSMGEQFVQALPDRNAAREAIAHLVRKRRVRRVVAREHNQQ